MNTRTNVSTSKRTLFIDFEMYADNDPEFKQELIALMIDNLNELHKAYGTSVKQKDPEIFRKACHKVKTTLVMLEDPEIDAVVEDLKKPDVDPGNISRFENIIAELVESLLGEK
ncbi:MAG: hypothetical protein C0490_14840 [Marivirga sp.]|nr:hypothetical protein [Marivirga sp.]